MQLHWSSISAGIHNTRYGRAVELIGQFFFDYLLLFFKEYNRGLLLLLGLQIFSHFRYHVRIYDIREKWSF